MLALNFISALLISAFACVFLIRPAASNPAPLPYEHMPSPVISVLSPEHNQIYTGASVPLTFNVSRPSLIGNFSIQYLLDGEPKELFTEYSGNYSVLMNELSSGLHYVEIKAAFAGEYYRKDGYIDGSPVWRINVAEVASSSGKIYFTVSLTSPLTTPAPTPIQKPTPSPEIHTNEPFPTTLVATASGASAVITGVGILAYFKKRKH